MHQMKSVCCTPPTPRAHRPKEAHVCARPSQGVGGKEENIPPPTPSEVMPRYDPSVAYVRGCPSKNPDKTIKAYVHVLLTKLSASQTAT
jgi:hypothetical protein